LVGKTGSCIFVKKEMMQFRYARHSRELAPLIDFYTKVLGLSLLGRFEGHAGYNGVFLGLPGCDWHIEFTESGEEVEHHPGPDDLPVFYPQTKEEREAVKKRARSRGAKFAVSKNPYWQKNGFEIRDPDGYGIVIARPPE